MGLEEGFLATLGADVKKRLEFADSVRLVIGRDKDSKKGIAFHSISVLKNYFESCGYNVETRADITDNAHGLTRFEENTQYELIIRA